MPKSFENQFTRISNLKKSKSRRKTHLENQSDLTTGTLPGFNLSEKGLVIIQLENDVTVSTSTPKSVNKGHKHNERRIPNYIYFCIEFLDPEADCIQNVQELYNSNYASRLGNGCIILLTLNVLAGLIKQNTGLSLSELCERTSKYLSVNGMKAYDRKTIMFHWKRFSNNPNLYSKYGRVFPARLGRPRAVSHDD